MGTTLVALVVHQSHAYLVSAGDSRAYLIGPYGASLLTSDDNQSTERMQRWVKEGWPRWRAQGPALTRYLGYFDAFDRPISPPLRCREFALLPSEQILLCTDGITHYLSDNEPEVARQLASVLLQATNPQEAACALVELANHAGGRDNASCVVLRAVPPQNPCPTPQRTGQ
jgi:protein phosphatase